MSVLSPARWDLDTDDAIVSGDHTRTIQIATPTNNNGLMKFAVKTVTCLGCKTKLVGSNSIKSMCFSRRILMMLTFLEDGAICKNCRPRTGELYQKQVSIVSAYQVRFSRLWTQCQRCQGSLHQDVLCESKDCPIFYMRKKAQKDVEDASGVLERFDGEEW